MAAYLQRQSSEESDLFANLHLYCPIPFPVVHPDPWKLCHKEVRDFNSIVALFTPRALFHYTALTLYCLSFFLCFQDTFEKGKALPQVLTFVQIPKYRNYLVMF